MYRTDHQRKTVDYHLLLQFAREAEFSMTTPQTEQTIEKHTDSDSDKKKDKKDHNKKGKVAPIQTAGVQPAINLQTLTEALQTILVPNQAQAQAQFQNQPVTQASGTHPPQGSQRSQGPWRGRGGRRGNWKPRVCWHCNDEGRTEEAKNHNAYTCPYLRNSIEQTKQLQASQLMQTFATSSNTPTAMPSQPTTTQAASVQRNTQALNWQGLTPAGGQASPQKQ